MTCEFFLFNNYFFVNLIVILFGGAINLMHLRLGGEKTRNTVKTTENIYNIVTTTGNIYNVVTTTENVYNTVKLLERPTLQ